MTYEHIITKIRPVILERDGYKCRVCSKTLELQNRNTCIHHIDGNRANNHPKNLLSLCKKCHNRLPKAIYFSSRQFPTKEKTTTKEGKKEYMKFYMRAYRARMTRKIT